MKPLPLLILALAVVAGTPRITHAQLPAWSVVNTGLDPTFGNAGKGVLDPQVAGITGVAFGNGTFVVVGASASETVIRWATSTDALTWTPHSQTIANGSKSFANSRIHFLNGKFMFFASHSTSTGFAETICYTSSDAVTWTANKVADSRPGFVEFAASSTTTVVAGSNGGQMISSNLTTWTASPVIPGGSGYDHNDIAYGNGRFISTINGFGGGCYTSADGVTWTAIPSLATPGGRYVEFGNGVFIVASGSDFYKSTDGITFTKYTPTMTSGWILGSDVRYAGGRFLATATDLTTLKQAFAASTDGVTWAPYASFPATPPPPAGQISRGYIPLDITFGNGKYVLAENDIQQTLLTKTVYPVIVVGDATAAPTPPAISSQPTAANAVIGGSASFSVAAGGTGLTYQWYFNGGVIAGATSATYTLTTVSAGNAGSYTVGVTNAAGTTLSAAATLTIVTGSNLGRIINLSVRSYAGTGDEKLIVGVVVGGAGVTGAKQALVRAIGPTLADYGVLGPILDPVMTLYRGSTVVAGNDNWGGDAQIVSVSAQLGAFALPSATSKDAAFYSNSVDAGIYSVQVTGAGSTTGVALAEIYDATPAGSFTATTPRLVNVSARTRVGTGDQKLIAGFVIGGSTAIKVLIRAVGPTLANYGVPGVVADPTLELYQGATKIAENDNWGGAAQLSAAFTTTGAFGLEASSKDAAMLVTLSPGVYSAQVSGVGGTTGTGLVEVYEVP